MQAILHRISYWASPSRRYRDKVLRYYGRKHHVRLDVVKGGADLTSPPPKDIGSYEAVASLTMFVGTVPTPAEVLFSSRPPHPEWVRRFDEDFFLAVELVARDFRVLGWDRLSWRLLKFSELAATSVGRPEFATRFSDRLRAQIHGSIDQTGPTLAG